MSKLSAIASLSDLSILSASRIVSRSALSISPLTFLFPRTPCRDLTATANAEVYFPSAPPLLISSSLIGGKALIRAF